VIGVAFAQNYETFLFFRLLIGAVGASFVITQYHTSVMFAPNVVGTANARRPAGAMPAAPRKA
jgi:NNP family nitrate/nitrite transporter-like MFS transporter